MCTYANRPHVLHRDTNILSFYNLFKLFNFNKQFLKQSNGIVFEPVNIK